MRKRPSPPANVLAGKACSKPRPTGTPTRPPAIYASAPSRSAVPHNTISCRNLPTDSNWLQMDNSINSGTACSGGNAVRKAVDDSGAAQCVIRTVHRKGVRFIGEVSDEGGVLTRVEAASSATEPTTVGRLSIVVLPFANLSNDPDQKYFTDGITGDLTAELSRIPDMLVISLNTAFTYRDKPVDTRQIGRELGVRYVLGGSVKRSGNRVRVTAQLIDAETDAHLWAERFDADAGDLFALQDEITSQIAVALNLELVAAESVRP